MGENQNTELQENSLENPENEEITFHGCTEVNGVTTYHTSSNKKNTTENPEKEVSLNVLVNRENLKMLMEQNQQLKKDLGALVSVFQLFVPMFSGKTSVLSLAPTIMKMINNKEVSENIQHIIPIIEKYNGQN